MATMRDALTEALAAAEPQADEPNDVTAPEAEDVAGTEAEPQDTEAPDARGEQSAEETTADSDIPTEYFGVDLSDLPADARQKFVDEFAQRDKFIQQLLREKADASQGSEPEEAAPEPEGISDEELLKALNIDIENDPFGEHVAKAALPLAKLVLSLNDQVGAMSKQNEVVATERYWETSLDSLERQYGKLPITRDELYREAATAGIPEPMDAYWRIMGPGRQQVHSEVQKRRAELEKTLKKGASGTTRPTSQVDTSEKVIDSTDVRDATRQALLSLAKERGYDYSSD